MLLKSQKRISFLRYKDKHLCKQNNKNTTVGYQTKLNRHSLKSKKVIYWCIYIRWPQFF